MTIMLQTAESTGPWFDVFARAAKLGLRWAVLYDTAHDTQVIRLLGQENLTLDMHVRLASVCKLVVGHLYAALCRQGRLRADMRVAKLLPHYIDELGTCTLGDLAVHRSGFQDALYNPGFRDEVNRDVSASQPLDRVLAASFAQGRAEATPHYANINAILLALCCEVVTEQSFENLVSRFAGLSYSAAGKLPQPHPTGFRRGRKRGLIEYGKKLFDATHYNPSWSGPAGGCTLRLDAVPAFCREVIGTLARQTSDIRGAYGNLMHFSAGWGCHAGDVPGFSAWGGHEVSTGRTIFAASGLCWADGVGNPAKEIARAAMADTVGA